MRSQLASLRSGPPIPALPQRRGQRLGCERDSCMCACVCACVVGEGDLIWKRHTLALSLCPQCQDFSALALSFSTPVLMLEKWPNATSHSSCPLECQQSSALWCLRAGIPEDHVCLRLLKVHDLTHLGASSQIPEEQMCE
jgi:hypothetical protein